MGQEKAPHLSLCGAHLFLSDIFCYNISMAKQTIFSGIQPSGKLHIGNYLGALSNFVTLQNSGNYDCFFTLVDYHSISENYEPKEKRGMVLDLAANFLAAGLSPEKSTILLQSQMPEHTELAWIFNCIVPVAELERMTQYKDKSQKQVKNINMGLFDYPVLMAADILIYKATAVPVGIDQKQHLELANVIARKFNNRFGQFFQEIKPLWTSFPKVMDLKRPDKKMSKSEPNGCIFIDDTPEEISKKLKQAVTASEVGQKSPGEENLMLLLSHFGKTDEIKHFTQAQTAGNLKYSELKDTLAGNISEYFAEFREKKRELLAKPEYLSQMLGDGATKARQVAQATLLEVKLRIGLL
jgi:tryptophanyl-tRNA synthetase